MTNAALTRSREKTSTEMLRDELLQIARWLEGRDISSPLANALEAAFPSHGAQFGRIADLIPKALARDGLTMEGSTVFLRLAEPSEASGGFSIDVVELEDVEGPRHTHPKGEIDLIVPFSDAGRFNGRGRGWLTLPPGSSHRPKASGKVAVIYLLPGGEMTF